MMQTIFFLEIRIQIAQKELRLEDQCNDVIARVHRSSSGTG
jgi:hypothetical protein